MATELEQRLARQRARADADDTGEPQPVDPQVVSLTSLSAAGRSRPDLERTIEVTAASPEGSAPSSQADLRRKLGSRRARVHRKSVDSAQEGDALAASTLGDTLRAGVSWITGGGAPGTVEGSGHLTPPRMSVGPSHSPSPARSQAGPARPPSRLAAAGFDDEDATLAPAVCARLKRLEDKLELRLSMEGKSRGVVDSQVETRLKELGERANQLEELSNKREANIQSLQTEMVSWRSALPEEFESLRKGLKDMEVAVEGQEAAVRDIRQLQSALQERFDLQSESVDRSLESLRRKPAGDGTQSQDGDMAETRHVSRSSTATPMGTGDSSVLRARATVELQATLAQERAERAAMQERLESLASRLEQAEGQLQGIAGRPEIEEQLVTISHSLSQAESKVRVQQALLEQQEAGRELERQALEELRGVLSEETGARKAEQASMQDRLDAFEAAQSTAAKLAGPLGGRIAWQRGDQSEVRETEEAMCKRLTSIEERLATEPAASGERAEALERLVSETDAAMGQRLRTLERQIAEADLDGLLGRSEALERLLKETDAVLGSRMRALEQALEQEQETDAVLGERLRVLEQPEQADAAAGERLGALEARLAEESAALRDQTERLQRLWAVADAANRDSHGGLAERCAALEQLSHDADARLSGRIAALEQRLAEGPAAPPGGLDASLSVAPFPSLPASARTDYEEQGPAGAGAAAESTAAAAGQLAQLSEEVGRLRQRLESLPNETPSQLAELSGEVGRLRQRLEAIPGETPGQLAELSEEVGRLRQRLEAGELAPWRQRLEAGERQPPTGEAVLAGEMQDKLTELSEEVGRLRQRLEAVPGETRGQLAELSEEVGHLRQRLEAVPGETPGQLAELSEEVGRLRHRLEAVPGETPGQLAELSEEVARLRQRLEAVPRETPGQLAELSEEVGRLRQRVEAPLEAVPDARPLRLAELSEEEVGHLRQRLEAAPGQLSELCQEVSCLRERLEALSAKPPSAEPAEGESLDKRLKKQETRISEVATLLMVQQDRFEELEGKVECCLPEEVSIGVLEQRVATLETFRAEKQGEDDSLGPLQRRVQSLELLAQATESEVPAFPSPLGSTHTELLESAAPPQAAPGQLAELSQEVGCLRERLEALSARPPAAAPAEAAPGQLAELSQEVGCLRERLEALSARPPAAAPAEAAGDGAAGRSQTDRLLAALGERVDELARGDAGRAADLRGVVDDAGRKLAEGQECLRECQAELSALRGGLPEECLRACRSELSAARGRLAEECLQECRSELSAARGRISEECLRECRAELSAARERMSESLAAELRSRPPPQLGSRAPGEGTDVEARLARTEEGQSSCAGRLDSLEATCRDMAGGLSRSAGRLEDIAAGLQELEGHVTDALSRTARALGSQLGAAGLRQATVGEDLGATPAAAQGPSLLSPAPAGSPDVHRLRVVIDEIRGRASCFDEDIARAVGASAGRAEQRFAALLSPCPAAAAWRPPSQTAAGLAGAQGGAEALQDGAASAAEDIRRGVEERVASVEALVRAQEAGLDREFKRHAAELSARLGRLEAASASGAAGRSPAELLAVERRVGELGGRLSRLEARCNEQPPQREVDARCAKLESEVRLTGALVGSLLEKRGGRAGPGPALTPAQGGRCLVPAQKRVAGGGAGPERSASSSRTLSPRGPGG